MLRTKVRRFMVISIEMQGRPARARSARRRQSCCPREVCAADRPAERRRHRAGSRASIRCARRRRAMVRASSARFSSESGSAHSCVLSPNPFGACGDQIGCRSCRSTRHRRVADSRCASNARSTATSQSCGVRNLRALVAPRLGQIDERGRHRAKIAVGVAKHAGDAIDRRRGRLVAHEMGDELRRQEPRGRRVTHERANDALTFLDAGFGVSRAEHCFRSRLVQQLLKRKSDAAVSVGLRSHGPAALGDGLRPPAAAASRARRQPTHRPARENLRELLHVLLGVAAVDAERVQLEQLARVVFVQPSRCCPRPRPALRASRARADRLKVVEVDEHRRMLRRCEQHVFEPARARAA